MFKTTGELVYSGDCAADEPAADAGVISDARPVQILQAGDSTAGPPPPVVFDRAGFSDRMMNDEELMREVMGEFLLDTSGQLADLRSRIDSGEAQQAGSAAHRIKGAAANVGGEAMREVAAAIEEAGKRGDIAPMKDAINKLEMQFVLLGNAMHEGLPTDS